MRLKEEDWANPNGVSDVLVEYPESLIAPFMDWIRKTRAWAEDPERVEMRVRKLNRDLMDWREDQKRMARTTDVAVNQVVTIMTDERGRKEVVADATDAAARKAALKVQRLANLARGREAAKQRKLAKTG